MADIELLTVEISMAEEECTELTTVADDVADVEAAELIPEEVVVEEDGDSDWETIVDSDEEVENVEENKEEEQVDEEEEEEEFYDEDSYYDSDESDDDIYFYSSGCTCSECTGPNYWDYRWNGSCDCDLCNECSESESESESESGTDSDSENSLLLSDDDDKEDSVLKCPSDYDSDIGEEIETRLAEAGRKTFDKFVHDVEDVYSDQAVLESEKCLLKKTKPWSKDKKLAAKDRQKFDQLAPWLWHRLNTLISNRDGPGILKWFEDIKPSKKAREWSRPDVNPVNLAAEVGSTAIFDFLLGESLSSGPVRIPFHECAVRGQFHFISHMLKMGFDVDVKDCSGTTALHALAKQSNDTSQMMKYLLSKGANINKTDYYEGSPLYYAVKNGATSNVITLIEAGASLDVSKGRETILETAVWKSLKMTAIIHKARIHQGKYDADVLLKLVESRLVKPARFLLKCNAQCNTNSLKKKSLIAFASTNKLVPQRIQMVDLLYKAGYEMNKGEKRIRDNASQCPMGDRLRKVYSRNLTRPKSLLMLATFKIRSLVGPSLPVSVHQLPLPLYLKNVVQLKHI